jgi:hypothetical protein
LNEDFRRSDFISLALMSSDILRVVVELLKHESADLRELVIKLLVLKIYVEISVYSANRKRKNNGLQLFGQNTKFDK